jgi:hypothetical protein
VHREDVHGRFLLSSCDFNPVADERLGLVLAEACQLEHLSPGLRRATVLVRSRGAGGHAGRIHENVLLVGIAVRKQTAIPSMAVLLKLLLTDHTADHGHLR